MTTINDLNTDDVISFETIAPSILQLKYTQVVFDGKTTWNAARAFDDIATLHRQLYPSMNQNEVKDDYRSYDYILFHTTSGPNAEITQTLGIPWIKSDSIVVSGNRDLKLIFPNITPVNEQYLYQLLRSNGFTNFQKD